VSVSASDARRMDPLHSRLRNESDSLRGDLRGRPDREYHRGVAAWDSNGALWRVVSRPGGIIVMTLGCLGSTACHPPAPPPPIWPEPRQVVVEDGCVPPLVPEPRLSPQLPQLALTGWEIEPSEAPLMISDDELHAMLADSDLELCTDNPFGPHAQRLDLDQAQREFVSTTLHSRAKRARSEGDLACTLTLIEAAYHYAPDEIGFAFEIAEAAASVGNCEKAIEALDFFLYYHSERRMPAAFERAKELLVKCHPPDEG
jgi:hypothetical protein